MAAVAACLPDEAGLEEVGDDQRTNYDSSRFVVVMCLFASRLALDQKFNTRGLRAGLLG